MTERTDDKEQRRTPMTDHFVSIRRWEDGQGPLDAWARFTRGMERELAATKETLATYTQIDSGVGAETTPRPSLAAFTDIERQAVLDALDVTERECAMVSDAHYRARRKIEANEIAALSPLATTDKPFILAFSIKRGKEDGAWFLHGEELVPGLNLVGTLPQVLADLIPAWQRLHEISPQQVPEAPTVVSHTATPDNAGDSDRWQDPSDLSGGETDMKASPTERPGDRPEPQHSPRTDEKQNYLIKLLDSKVMSHEEALLEMILLSRQIEDEAHLSTPAPQGVPYAWGATPYTSPSSTAPQTEIERFMDWAGPAGFTLDHLFMASAGVPENPFEDRDTKMAFDIWLASSKARSATATTGEKK